MDNKKTKIFLLLGLACITIAIILFLVESSSTEQNLEIMRGTDNAYEAARQIAQNNRNEVLVHMLRMFLLGIGATLTLFSGILLLKKNQS